MNTRLYNTLLHYQHTFHPVVEFNAMVDKLRLMDFTSANNELTDEIIASTKKFSGYIDMKLEGYKYGIGGYNEDRILYKRSKLFDSEEPQTNSMQSDLKNRTIHLGIDIWAPAGTKVFAPIGGMVHSFSFNNNFGDYGATIILQHQIETIPFHTLYGHVSIKDLAGLQEGKYINRGEEIGQVGEPEENGDWPPHLHFQIIEDMELKEGDYPGVCGKTDRDWFLKNCPNPDLILNMMSQV